MCSDRRRRREPARLPFVWAHLWHEWPHLHPHRRPEPVRPRRKRTRSNVRPVRLSEIVLTSCFVFVLRLSSSVSASLSSRCPAVAIRLLLQCRCPDFLLRLLKWLVQSQAELREQRQMRQAQAISAKTCIAQIDRVLAHWYEQRIADRGDKRSARSDSHAHVACTSMSCLCLSAMQEEMAWKLLWKLELIIKSGSNAPRHRRGEATTETSDRLKG